MNLLEPFQYAFFMRGLVASTIVGLLCGLVSVYVTIRKMSYIGHGLSHAIFGGAAVAFALGCSFYAGAALWGVLAALLIAFVTYRRRVASDAAIGIITTASFAMGIAVISRATRFTKNLDAALFGNILGVTQTDLLILGIVFLCVLGTILFFYRQLLFTSFDPDVAPLYGVKRWQTETVFALILAITITASLGSLGVTLIAALLVLPASTARLLVHDFNKLLILSPILGAASGIVGMYLSYALNIASGASIVLTASALFGITFLLSGKHMPLDIH